MPTHWESSKRPLFVRTVLVNGSRHAILTQEDPLGQTITANAAKTSRPNSAQSSHSSSNSSSVRQSADENIIKPAAPEKGTTKGPKDLQACLVKLRLVLAAQETKKSSKLGGRRICETGNKKRKRVSKCNNNKKACDWHECTQDSIEPDANQEINELDLQPTYKYDTNQNITVASFFTSEPKNYAPIINEQNVERISGHMENAEYDAFASYDVPWNTVSTETYFTRPFYNRLSERVLQWLDMANKKKEKPIENKTENLLPKVEEKPQTKTVRRVLNYQESLEDNAEEVRVEEDVDTALSRECLKFTQDLNRLHYLKSNIPVKQETYTNQLQESIAQSFTTIVSIRSGKYATPKPKPLTKPHKKGHLTRQIRLEESSDEDQKDENLLEKIEPSFSKKVNDCPASQLSFTNYNKIPWLRSIEREISKPQLHIFIPVLPTEKETVSDSASESSVSHASN